MRASAASISGVVSNQLTSCSSASRVMLACVCGRFPASICAARMVKFSIADLGNFDDEALRTFLDPRDGGIDPDTLGRALQGADVGLVDRVGTRLPPDATRRF